jgi:hypothetical protein
MRLQEALKDAWSGDHNPSRPQEGKSYNCSLNLSQTAHLDARNGFPESVAQSLEMPK